MNADQQNRLSHHAVNRPPAPSRNGADGDLQLDADSPSAERDIDAVATGETEPSPSPNGANGRDQHGRFAKGNPGGPGNPFARRTAQLRRVLSMAVSDEDIEAVAKRLLEQAKVGDVAAARLLLSYAIGQPTPAVDPDTLDQQEWAIFKQVPVPAPEVERLLHDVPLDFACELARALVPHLADVAKKKAQPILNGQSKSSKKQRKRAKGCKLPATAVSSRLDLFFPSP
jgi:hypothetical protein